MKLDVAPCSSSTSAFGQYAASPVEGKVDSTSTGGVLVEPYDSSLGTLCDPALSLRLVLIYRRAGTS